MVVYSVECRTCGTTRVGREKGNGVTPVKAECPECGTNEFTVPALD